MTESKILSEKHQISSYRLEKCKSPGNGYTFVDGSSFGNNNVEGRNYSNGFQIINGNSSGMGVIFGYLTEISDPIFLNPLQFWSFQLNKTQGWDQTWNECSDEQKQHLLLFLPLRDTNV